MTNRLLLVQPRFEAGKLDRNNGTLMPLGLAYVAAYTPAGWDIDILDEQVERRALPDADLVGITTTTLTATRAYAVAAHYRARGVKVVLGGVHASMVPDEALEHADAVVIGDAEPVWAKVVEDAAAGALERIYRAPIETIDGLRAPRRELLRGRYLLGSVSTSRGCPFRCTFCCIHNFYQQTTRFRPIDEVIDELRGLKRGLLFFTDGNLYGYTKEARARFVELCRRIAEERTARRVRVRRWMAYATVNILEDEEALSAAAEAGCKNLLVGFESINPESLKEMRKATNIRRVGRYRELIRNASRHGILVTAEIVLGFDADTKETLELTRQFVRDSGFDVLRLQILQPLPGTETYERLAKEHRLWLSEFPEDWDRLRDNFVLGVNFEPKQLEPWELKSFVVEMGREFYSLPKIAWSGLRGLLRYRDPVLSGYQMVLALKARKTYANFDLSRETVEREARLLRERCARIAEERRHLPVVS